MSGIAVAGATAATLLMLATDFYSRVAASCVCKVPDAEN
jgi:hypothetical protein